MTNKFELQGKATNAKIYATVIDDVTIGQIQQFINEDYMTGTNVVIMPDTHAGKGAVIGTTMTVKDKVCPNLVGVDIGCGILVRELDIKEFTEDDFRTLEYVINKYVPSGQAVHSKKSIDFDDLEDLSFKLTDKDLTRTMQSIGTLGGGNHFISVEKSKNDNRYYLLIHSGSRILGQRVAKHHQEIAEKECSVNNELKNKIIDELKQSGRQNEIQEQIKQIKPKVQNKELSYLEGNLFRQYMNDQAIAVKYAALNRKTMADNIVKHMNWKVVDEFDSIHNYIDPETNILRKGATDASLDTKLIIPLNMKDGSVIAKGLGNSEFNYSAPHGAGRVLSRSKAKAEIKMKDYEDDMKGIYTNSVSKETLDESRFAYKKPEDILENITETCEIIDTITTIYNFKARD